MALKATIYKAELQIADMDRHYYQNHQLTLARHPSETEERLMMRLLAFSLNAHELLSFTKGLSEADEPDLWQQDLTGSIDLWIEIGQPDERRLSKACGRAKQVLVYAYGGNVATTWWQQTEAKLARLNNLSVYNLPYQYGKTLAEFARRTMNLQASIQEQQLMLSDGETSLTLELDQWK